MKIAEYPFVDKPVAPADYEELIRLIHERYESMSKGYQTIALYLTQNPNDVAVRSVNAIAEICGIHGSNFVDTVKIIWNGVPEKGMITWKTTLNPQQIHAVASYIYTMRGTNPKNPKPPENLTPVKTGPSEYE